MLRALTKVTGLDIHIMSICILQIEPSRKVWRTAKLIFISKMERRSVWCMIQRPRIKIWKWHFTITTSETERFMKRKRKRKVVRTENLHQHKEQEYGICVRASRGLTVPATILVPAQSLHLEIPTAVPGFSMRSGKGIC